jgi:hypothetical protein
LNNQHSTLNARGFKILRIAYCVLLIRLLTPAATAQLVTGNLLITNAPVNTSTLTVNGYVFTWTNGGPVGNQAVLITNTLAGDGTNLLQVTGLLLPSAASISITQTNGTNLTFLGLGMAMSVTTNWASLVLTTNGNSPGTNVTVPMSTVAATARTNMATQLVADLNTYSQTPINQTSLIAAQLAGLTNAQTLGNKTITNSLISGGTNSGVVISASPAISGVLVALTNGFLTNTGIYNGTNLGLPFRSPGGGTGSEQFGSGAAASTNQATAVGSGAQAVGSSTSAFGRLAAAVSNSASAFGVGALAGGAGSIAIGNTANALLLDDIAIGALAVVSGGNSIAIGVTANATGASSVAIGNGAAASVAHQIVLGTSAEFVQFPGNVAMSGNTTNETEAGTFTVAAEMILRRFNNTGLANGANQDVQLGTNCDTKLSGPTAAFTTAGFAAPTDDQFNFVQNSTAFQWTINNLSGFESTAANRIFTGTGVDVVLSSNSWALFKYDAAQAYWVLLFASGAPSSGGSGSFSGTFTGTLATPLTIGAATNTPSFTFVNTNWISGALYTNSTGRPILVSGSVVLTTGSVVGYSQMALSVPGSVTNYASVLSAIGGLTGAMTNGISPAFVTNGGTFAWTNSSSGAGDSSTTWGGQFMVY